MKQATILQSGSTEIFDKNYANHLMQIIRYGTKELNVRTKTNTYILPNQLLHINMSLGRLPVTGMRKMYPKSAAAEFAWIIQGTKKLDWLQQYTKMWDKFANEKNEIVAAYGCRWRQEFGRDQLQAAINTLRKDPTNRQVVVMAWDAGKDGLGNYHASNVPCPIGFILNIIDKKLNMTVMMRSSDAVVGLPYDIMMYSFLFYAIANELRANFGMLTMYLAHAHIYECHEDIARQMIYNRLQPEYLKVDQSIVVPGLSLTEIQEQPDSFMGFVEGAVARMIPSEYAPKAEVVL